MSKKIIILNGSPRANGNTSALTAEFKRGAEEVGNEVREFHLARMKINGCLGCWRGGKDAEHPCTQHDDMEQFYPTYREADVVVLALPLYYYWFISGFLKNAFDRLVPGIGAKKEAKLVSLGYPTLESPKDADPDDLYLRTSVNQGQQLDKCVLYAFRCAVAYAKDPAPDPQKHRW